MNELFHLKALIILGLETKNVGTAASKEATAKLIVRGVKEFPWPDPAELKATGEGQEFMLLRMRCLLVLSMLDHTR